ncbi:HAD superfamily hydrolase (TIGR01509 family)/beta-phosphoglucomutase family hydrolase [Mesocricetibacter intestinalis]|uniref:HAD superfamily hydrolase (TIGR01509 family)/beta-phosphoglucomutase family hydrolase n=1 Tax=Mesocricetibacter intestinalis TaxID=1521930 RepID=A0A4R6VBZ0_9PAST|nr:beta-phosphoglucomutase family hydrolase [Mesocricetibacter intestinalis]TDQ58049.1 HAD superfamily hydrolase (TIGR01509 family)/beta-phosphoglucomutase family hydrolase [Mesocricetibacter intestinalis]
MQALNLINQYQGLIFDMDGTLIDTMPSHAKAWVKVGEYFGYPFQGDVMYRFAGASVHTIALETMKKYGMPLEQVDEVVEMKRRFGRELLKSEARLLPAADIVKHFFNRKPMALGTGSLRPITDMLLNRLDLKHYFNAVVTSEDVAAHKPAPDTFLRCAQLIEVEAERCLVFEDADLGVQAGLAAGMDVFDVRIGRIVRDC